MKELEYWQTFWSCINGLDPESDFAKIITSKNDIDLLGIEPLHYQVFNQFDIRDDCYSLDNPDLEYLIETRESAYLQHCLDEGLQNKSLSNKEILSYKNRIKNQKLLEPEVYKVLVHFDLGYEASLSKKDLFIEVINLQKSIITNECSCGQCLFCYSWFESSKLTEKFKSNKTTYTDLHLLIEILFERIDKSEVSYFENGLRAFTLIYSIIFSFKIFINQCVLMSNKEAVKNTLDHEKWLQKQIYLVGRLEGFFENQYPKYLKKEFTKMITIRSINFVKSYDYGLIEEQFHEFFQGKKKFNLNNLEHSIKNTAIENVDEFNSYCKAVLGGEYNVSSRYLEKLFTMDRVYTVMGVLEDDLGFEIKIGKFYSNKKIQILEDAYLAHFEENRSELTKLRKGQMKNYLKLFLKDSAKNRSKFSFLKENPIQKY